MANGTNSFKIDGIDQLCRQIDVKTLRGEKKNQQLNDIIVEKRRKKWTTRKKAVGSRVDDVSNMDSRTDKQNRTVI